MDIKNTADLLIKFTFKRLAEIFGICITIVGLLLFIALITYSPEDPNFIFPQNTQIKNILGFQGSFISDLFFQSIGLISYLFSITLMVTGINIFRLKEFYLFIENLFFATIYSIFGTLFLGYFYSDTFVLYINGNGGFIGSYLNNTFLNTIILTNEIIFYYILIFFIVILFLISINFHPIKFYKFIIKLINIFTNDKQKSYTNNNEDKKN